MSFVAGVHLLPATGEFTYDPIVYRGRRPGADDLPINSFFAPGGARSDYSYAIDQLQESYPGCTTVSLVCAWFGDSTDASACRIYPSTTYIGGDFERLADDGWVSEDWQVSGLTQGSPELIPIPAVGANFIYGGTPSDQSVVRCIQDLKARGLRVIFYPFILMTCPGLPWRGRIGYAPDLSAAAAGAIGSFLGGAAISDFAPDAANLTVAYSGSPDDYSYRRMILHYAWLCTIAGGVDLFLIGSELRGLETIRGPSWTRAGTSDGAGAASWDYPFVAGLRALAGDVRVILDSRGLARNLSTLKNLIAYSADWSVWMGYQHPGENGQWPHLDSLFADDNIDVVGFDNYLPLSDWTTTGGLDVDYWDAPAPNRAWPPSAGDINGLGLAGAPTIYSKAYLKANIEGGEKFHWFYQDSDSAGRGLDSLGSDQQISRPEGDRQAQSRRPYFANQEILANKQLRWWWNNPHRAVYDNGDGTGWSPHGAPTAWRPQSKSIAFIEYGFPATDKGTNQPNVFYNPSSVESFTPYWSVWRSASGGSYLPLRDDTIPLLALQAVYEYWNDDGNNEMSGLGVPMIQFAFSCIWNWDARPFPVFPIRGDEWGDVGNWSVGQWLPGRGPATPPLPPSAAPSPGIFPQFPTLAARSWSTITRPRFATDAVGFASGRSSRRSRYATALYDIELIYEGLRAEGADAELQSLVGFFEQANGQDAPFWLAPPGQERLQGEILGTGDGATTRFALTRAFGGYREPAPGTSGVAALYVGGALVAPARYSVTSGYLPAVVLDAPPAIGEEIVADFDWLWLCRFAEDVLDAEEFMAMLFALRLVKLRTVRF